MLKIYPMKQALFLRAFLQFKPMSNDKLAEKKINLLSKDVYVPAALLGLALMGGILWGQLTTRMSTNETSIKSLDEKIEVIEEYKERIIKLETRYDVIIDNLNAIKNEVSSLNAKLQDEKK